MQNMEPYQLNWLYEITKIDNMLPCSIEEMTDYFREHFGYRKADSMEVLLMLEDEGALHITRKDPDDDPYDSDMLRLTDEAKDLSFVQNVLNSAENGQTKDVLFHFFRLQDDQTEDAIAQLVSGGYLKYVQDIVTKLIGESECSKTEKTL